MTNTAALRRVPLRLLVAVALVAGLLTAVLGRDSAVAEHAGTGGHSMSQRGLTARELAFHDQMRKLWEDHITWTRLAIVTFAAGTPGFPTTAARLLRNQKDIGEAIEPFFGEAADDQLAALLHDHITIAVDILKAAKAGDTDAVTAAETRWYANANDIADFLAKANPRFWPDRVMREDMKVHLDQTLAEAVDELQGNYAASVRDYEAVHLHILRMADMLSDGIIGRFPARFH